MKIAICDDEALETEKLKHLITAYSFKKNYDLFIDVFNSPFDLLEKDKYDLYFLDYIMPEMNGVSLALKLYEKFNKAITVCYLTSYENAAIDVINSGVSAQAFLTKPVCESDLFSLLDKLYNQSVFNRLILKQERTLITVYPQDIIYIEIISRKSVFTFMDSKKEFKYTLSELENDILPSNMFFKVHRSIIINMQHVDAFDAKSIRMKNGDVLPLTRHKEFNSTYTSYILG